MPLGVGQTLGEYQNNFIHFVKPLLRLTVPESTYVLEGLKSESTMSEAACTHTSLHVYKLVVMGDTVALFCIL